MPTCGICGKPILRGQPHTVIAGAHVHWDCWEKAGRPSVVKPAAPPKPPKPPEVVLPPKRYVMPIRTQNEMKEWTKKAWGEDREREIEWGGGLYLKDDEVVLRNAVIGGVNMVRIGPLANEAAKPVGTVHLHPTGHPYFSNDDVIADIFQITKIPSEFRFIAMLVYSDDTWQFHVYPKKEEVKEAWRTVLSDTSDEVLLQVIDKYHIDRKAHALQFLTFEKLRKDGRIERFTPHFDLGEAEYEISFINEEVELHRH